MKLPHIKLKLFTQMVLLISIVICATSILAAIFFTRIMDDLSAQYLGHEAMSVAKLAAQDDRIIRAFKSDNPSKEIQPIAEKMRKLTGASYIVIGNKWGIRYSHPNPKYIGKSMGTSNEPFFFLAILSITRWKLMDLFICNKKGLSYRIRQSFIFSIFYFYNDVL